jgi:hypothetical protein
MSAIEEERASKQSRANMMRAQLEHAERIKEFVARHQRRCYAENRPNLTLWFDDFGSAYDCICIFPCMYSLLYFVM